ncbi:hypothetical protein ACH5RR_007572 [Cinchona calisaya]|uniref:Uncharacterized protein n=1 Tax=Cinchona calisaya TaxID=153742 RepID=A0ABD3ASK5_9GENT
MDFGPTLGEEQRNVKNVYDDLSNNEERRRHYCPNPLLLEEQQLAAETEERYDSLVNEVTRVGKRMGMPLNAEKVAEVKSDAGPPEPSYDESSGPVPSDMPSRPQKDINDDDSNGMVSCRMN